MYCVNERMRKKAQEREREARRDRKRDRCILKRSSFGPSANVRPMRNDLVSEKLG
jgi:hypothetical protein